MLGHEGDSEALAERRGKVGVPLPASTLLYWLPKKQEGVVWATHDIGKFCSEQSRHLCAHSHHPSRKNISRPIWAAKRTPLSYRNLESGKFKSIKIVKKLNSYAVCSYSIALLSAMQSPSVMLNLRDMLKAPTPVISPLIWKVKLPKSSSLG